MIRKIRQLVDMEPFATCAVFGAVLRVKFSPFWRPGWSRSAFQMRPVHDRMVTNRQFGEKTFAMCHGRLDVNWLGGCRCLNASACDQLCISPQKISYPKVQPSHFLEGLGCGQKLW